MQVSDWINVILCILSFVLAMVSVATVVVTLKQNNKMIENSTKPYIVAFPQTANFQEPIFYLVIKNFGSSGATIKEMVCDIDLSDVSYRKELNPFNHISGTFLAPGQSISCSLCAEKFKENNICGFDVKLKYSNGIKEYSQTNHINYKAFTENVNIRAATEGRELRAISYSLQDLVEKQF